MYCSWLSTQFEEDMHTLLPDSRLLRNLREARTAQQQEKIRSLVGSDADTA